MDIRQEIGKRVSTTYLVCQVISFTKPTQITAIILNLYKRYSYTQLTQLAADELLLIQTRHHLM